MRRQRGIAVDALLYIIAALAVLGAGAFGVYKFTSAIERAERAERDAATLKSNNDTLTRAHHDLLAEAEMQRQRQARTDLLLAERQTARAAAQTTQRSIDDAINAAIRTRPATRDWADTPVPADVLAGLRNAAPGGSGEGGQNHTRATATQPAGGGRDPGLAGQPDQR